MKKFNTVGQCVPGIHYMVNIDDKLQKIKDYVDNGYYFVINRARQYGKTTTLKALTGYLQKEYGVIFLSFQRMSAYQFKNEHVFSAAFTDMFLRAIDNKKNPVSGIQGQTLNALRQEAERETFNLGTLFLCLNDICGASEKPLVLIIDEVDSASNNQVFLDFLAQLRDAYIERFDTSAFQSVILAGVYDIKNLKQKIRPDEAPRYNSPWNIAEPFDVDMAFSAEAIEGMLKEYEKDHHTGMDTKCVARCIYEYTSGYPFLVSDICKIIDTAVCDREGFSDQSAAWTEKGVAEAVKIILREPATIFDSLVKQIDAHQDLREMLKAILFQGSRLTFNPDHAAINMGKMFGYIKDRNGVIAVANRIFEMRLYNLFLSEEELTSATYQEAQKSKNQFIHAGILDMRQVLERFVAHFSDVYGDNDEKFVEKYGRKLFLLYLKPIINGIGNYYVEAETRDAQRTDVIVDYRGQQFIIELKIWGGKKYNEDGEKQLSDYLERYHLDKGYLLTFSFNKNKKPGVSEVIYGDKTLIEAIV